MTQPDPQQYAQQPAAAPQPVQQVQPGGDLPTVGTHDTAVEGTFNGAGQPTEDGTAPLQAVYETTDENFVGLVQVQYTGSDVYEQDGFSFSPNETKIVNAEEARNLVADGSFKVV